MADDQVPFENSVVADSTMNALGGTNIVAIDVNSAANHNECVEFALLFADFFFTTFQRIDDLTSVHDPELANYFSFFPNPANDVLFIKNKKENGLIQLMDTNGRLLLETTLEEGSNQVNIASIPTGMYFLKLYSEDSFFTEKVLIQK